MDTVATHAAPGELMRYESVRVLLVDRGGTMSDLVPVGRNHTDDMLLLEPVARDSVEVNYVMTTGDLIAEGGGNAALLGSVDKGLSIAEVFGWLHTVDGRLCGHPLSWLIGRMSALSHEPAVCESLEEFGAWRHVGLGAATTTLGCRQQADVYADMQGESSKGVRVYFVHQTGDIYAHDDTTDNAALLGQIDPARREEFIEWAGSPSANPTLTHFVAKIEVFNNLGLCAEKPALPVCWDDEPHWWASDRVGGHLPEAYAGGVVGPVANEVCYRCGLTRRTSLVGTVNNPLGQQVELPVAVLMGPKIVVTGGPGAKMAPNPRGTFVRLVSALFPERAVVTLSDEDVSDLNCPNCDVWVGDLRNREIAHVSTTHRQGDGWTCEAEAPSGLAL